MNLVLTLGSTGEIKVQINVCWFDLLFHPCDTKVNTRLILIIIIKLLKSFHF